MEIAAAAQWSEAEQVPLGYARPSDTLAAEQYFSDVHAAGKMIRLFRARGRELCEAFSGSYRIKPGKLCFFSCKMEKNRLYYSH